MKKEDLKIVFFGTPEFAVESLDALIVNGYNVAAVVTMPDKTAGRGHKTICSDVKKYAVEHSLRLLQPEKLRDPEFIATLKEIDADLFIVIAFRMLPETVWGMPRLGTFNLHASLLPRYRGAAPINRAIINGETRTGVTTFFLRHEIDTGDIIDQEEVEITPADNAGTLHDKLMHLGAEMVSRTVGAIADGTLKTRAQPEGDFVPAPKIFKEDCRIDWNLPAIQIHNLVRGLSPYPAAWTEMTDSRGSTSTVKIFETRLAESGSNTDRTSGLCRGMCVCRDRRLFVQTADTLIEILSLQPAGKKRMDTADFLLGYHPETMK